MEQAPDLSHSHPLDITFYPIVMPISGERGVPLLEMHPYVLRGALAPQEMHDQADDGHNE
jgi:hypothetical protein